MVWIRQEETMLIQDKKTKTNRRVISFILAVLIVVSSVAASTLIIFAGESTPPPVRILADALGNNVSIHSELQELYQNDVLQYASSYADGTSELSRPAKITLTWHTEVDEAYAAANGISTGENDYTVYFGKTENLSDAKTYTTAETSYQVTNLELNTTYYWKVASEIGGEHYESNTASFKTERNGPRTLYVSGVTNVRDIGGYTTLSGDTVRQGRIIRCGRLHNSDGSIKITEKGITEMRENLGIRSEIELRKASNNEYGGVKNSVLGTDVNYFLLPMEYKGNLLEGEFSEDNIGSLRGVFDVLSKEENYPVIFHCSIGTDRTGMVAYCLEALLGMSETDIIRDYLYSNFGKIGGPRYVSTISSLYPQFIKNFDGKTLQEKTYRFLNEYVGVPAEQLDAVIRMNLIPRDDTLHGEPVSSEADFLSMQADGDYYLAKDIALSSGYPSPFFGTLDGNGHTVTTAAPLFDTLSGVVKNLTIQGTVVSSSGRSGALAREGSRLTCINVSNEADVTETGQYYVGGLVGYSTVWATFINCENHGAVTSAHHAAGIVCRTGGELTLSNCKNDGTVTATPPMEKYYAGGMVAKSGGSVMMQNCQNSGEVISSCKHIGGLGGYLDTAEVMKTVIACENSGKLTCTADNEQVGSYMGGIAGFMNGGSSYCTISYCSNSGEILSHAAGKTLLCGICGYVNSDSIVITYCSNTGSESATNADECYCYHLYYNKVASDEAFIHDNDPWQFDNVTFEINGIGSYTLPHEMTFGEWIREDSRTSGNAAVWVSPVTGLTEAQISGNPAFENIWRLYRDDVQGQLYAELPSHRDANGSLKLPDQEIMRPDGKPATVFDLITPNDTYPLSN